MSYHFKLYDAVMCAECETIFESGPKFCPSCTCSAFLILSSVVKPKVLRAEIDLCRMMNDYNAHLGAVGRD